MPVTIARRNEVRREAVNSCESPNYAVIVVTKTKTMATGNAAGFLIAAEIDDDILLEEVEGIVVAEYAILRHLDEERKEERPQNPVRVSEVTVPLYSQFEFQKNFRMHREIV